MYNSSISCIKICVSHYVNSVKCNLECRNTEDHVMCTNVQFSALKFMFHAILVAQNTNFNDETPEMSCTTVQFSALKFHVFCYVSSTKHELQHRKHHRCLRYNCSIFRVEVRVLRYVSSAKHELEWRKHPAQQMSLLQLLMETHFSI